MKFCVICNNMYYISLSAEPHNDKLTYYCRNCGHIDTDTMVESVCVLNTKIKTNDLNFNHIVNEYTKYDPTLPRIYNIPCPNANCETNKNNEKEVEKEIIYIRYDDNNLKFLYICVSCDTIWTTNKNT